MEQSEPELNLLTTFSVDQISSKSMQ